MPDLFEDTEVDTETTPAPVAGSPVQTGTGWFEKVRWKWSTLSRGGKVLVAVLAAIGGLCLYAIVGGGGNDTKTPPPTTVLQAAPPPTASTEPPRRLIVEAKNRPVGDPLRNLPDLHQMVYAYAGADADTFSNVIRTLLSSGGSMCDLFFGVDAQGWRVVPRTADTAYPNDFFPVRVFTSAPCPTPTGNPDPQSFIPPTTVPAAPAK